MSSTKTEKLLRLMSRRHVIRPRDLVSTGIPRTYLNRLAERGQLQRLERGLYTADQGSPSEHMALEQIAHKAPNAVICLLSALRFHEIGTQMPSEVWIAIDA